MKRWLAYLLFRDVIAAAEDERERWVRTCIHGDGWWFSHDTPTMEVIHALALGKRGVCEIRDRWHRQTGKGRPGIDAPRYEHTEADRLQKAREGQ